MASAVDNAEESAHLKELLPYIGKYKRALCAPIGDPIVAEWSSKPEAVVKQITFVRHGQGDHNLAAIVAGHGCSCDGATKAIDCPYLDPDLKDPPLTDLGCQQALANREKAAKLRLQTVFVSPLRRALKTAVLGFANHDGVDTNFHVIESAREQYGLHWCDCRQTKTILSQEYPEALFPAELSEDDELWTEQRESKASLIDRATETLLTLARHDARELALVTHSSFLKAMFAVVLDFGACEKAEDGVRLARWFETGELRTLVVNFDRLL
eukprot:TRINITY_DN3071_c0_g1_i1.p1 TRINITY_DN3071_c0_g1~~TRINITY_DN3071_c0_g1_i1.p1  ORF type:complete len:269 (+),score=44.57 TRINITY_DN3071_c0_g1_i1:1-807(+)